MILNISIPLKGNAAYFKKKKNIMDEKDPNTIRSQLVTIVPMRRLLQNLLQS